MTEQGLQQKDFIGILESLEKGEISSGQAAERLLIEQDCHEKVSSCAFAEWTRDNANASIRYPDLWQPNKSSKYLTTSELYDKYKESNP